MNDPTRFPADSRADGFPHPNPLFPVPPRAFTGKERHWHLFAQWGWAVMIPGGVVILFGFREGWFGFTQGATMFASMVGLGLIVASPLFWWAGRLRFRQWTSGRIVPALVIRARPPKELHIAGKIGLGLIAGLVGAGDVLNQAATTGIYHVRYNIGADIWEERVCIARAHEALSVGDVIWIATLDKGRRAQAIQQYAPPEFASAPVPDHIADTTRAYLEASDPAEFKRSAEAARRASKHATRYEKRPNSEL